MLKNDKHDAAAEEGRRACTSAACAPTTWACSAAAGRSAGAAGAARSRPGPPSARRSRRSWARRDIDYSENAAGAEKADVVVAVVGEDPYAEGSGDRAKLELGAQDLALVDAAKRAASRSWSWCCSGRPLILGDVLDAATRWSPPGCRGPRATASPTCSSAPTSRPASSPSPGRANDADPDQRRRSALRAAVPVWVRPDLVSVEACGDFRL